MLLKFANRYVRMAKGAILVANRAEFRAQALVCFGPAPIWIFGERHAATFASVSHFVFSRTLHGSAVSY